MSCHDRRPRASHVLAFLLPALLVGLFLLCAALLSGCAAPLTTAVNVANALGKATEAAGAQLNADFAKADKACLWTPSGAVSPLELDRQAQCVAHTRALYAPALRAYDDFLALWPAFAALVHFAEAAEVLGRQPDMTKILALLPDVLRTADAFTTAYSTLVSPPLPTLPIAPASAAKVP